ncbi:MAG: Asp-tRNA(Asn)/Glu-tRNA(Gln) amidotransferase subunit GatC [Waddliaceae bacterium]
MAELNETQIKKLTELSRIDCTEEERESLLQDLKKILDYVDQLQKVDTENVEPCIQVLSQVQNVMREDVVGETMSRETFLSNAPEQIGGMIRVPPVIKGK